MLEGIEISGVTATEVYDVIVEDIMAFASKENITHSRDGRVIYEIINAHVSISDPTYNIVNSTARTLNKRYAIGEMLWYLSRNRELKSIGNITDNWKRFSDDGVYVNSNYGELICNRFGFDQLESAYYELVRHPDSRRAILQVRPPFDYLKDDTKDDTCTVYIQFLIRDEKLICIANMRSNDIYLGFPNDVFCFTCLQIYMAMRLGIKIGTYYHNVGSLHLYERDYDKMLKNLGED